MLNEEINDLKKNALVSFLSEFALKKLERACRSCVYHEYPKFLGSREEIVGEGNGNPLQYSCLENPTDRGAWWAAVHGVAKSRTRLSNFTFTFTFMHWRRKWQPTPVFLPGESQGQWSLVGCRLWGHTESDTTEVTSSSRPERNEKDWEMTPKGYRIWN